MVELAIDFVNEITILIGVMLDCLASRRLNKCPRCTNFGVPGDAPVRRRAGVNFTLIGGRYSQTLFVLIPVSL